METSFGGLKTPECYENIALLFQGSVLKLCNSNVKCLMLKMNCFDFIIMFHHCFNHSLILLSPEWGCFNIKTLLKWSEHLFQTLRLQTRNGEFSIQSVLNLKCLHARIWSHTVTIRCHSNQIPQFFHSWLSPLCLIREWNHHGRADTVTGLNQKKRDQSSGGKQLCLCHFIPGSEPWDEIRK